MKAILPLPFYKGNEPFSVPAEFMRVLAILAQSMMNERPKGGWKSPFTGHPRIYLGIQVRRDGLLDKSVFDANMRNFRESGVLHLQCVQTFQHLSVEFGFAEETKRYWRKDLFRGNKPSSDLIDLAEAERIAASWYYPPNPVLTVTDAAIEAAYEGVSDCISDMGRPYRLP